jgi:putative DNA methylase
LDKDTPRLIEVAFPLKQTSLDSVHEKNVRHGHISTLHLWPARRPLAACRAALIATLLPDPGNDAERKELLEKIGGIVKKENTFKTVGDRKIPIIKEFTEGGILHWGRENGPAMDYFREEIKKAYGGRAPRVLDPFAGGGAIPLEAMRLGCEATAVDINPVAWFILKCTLEYPQKFAGKTHPLPSFALQNAEFMEEFLKGTSKAAKKSKKQENSSQPSLMDAPEADLSWHVRTWAYWVLEQARKDLGKYYPVIDGKPTVAYLWARTVTCKNCRATIPLLKTLWLCKRGSKRKRIQIKPRANRSGVDFEIVDEPLSGGNDAQQRAYDQRVGKGTMIRSGAWCPVCGNQEAVTMTLDDIKADMIVQREMGNFGKQLTVVVVEGLKGKEYRLPEEHEIQVEHQSDSDLGAIFRDIPFGIPLEPIPGNDRHRAAGSQLPNYGFKCWSDLFTSRQLLALGTLVKYSRTARNAMRLEGYADDWIETIEAYLACIVSRTVDYMATLCVWEHGAEEVKHVFMRWALQMTWDFAEANPLAPVERFYLGGTNSAFRVLGAILSDLLKTPVHPNVINKSALLYEDSPDIIFTDPPYYDAIPYSDLMDFFYIWIRRIVGDRYPKEFASDLTQKKEELVQQHNTGPQAMPGKVFYETGMSNAFSVAYNELNTDGRLVIVFANKQFDAWETLVGSVIKAGFCVTGSWPIVTEMSGGLRNLNRAALASSVWLVCRKREEYARPGWDSRVMEEMKENIEKHLPKFWDAGIRGPDFIWAATGPALESYSKYPAVKKADQPDSLMSVSEFLGHVRRMVVNFVVGRLLSANGETAEALDDLTIYYLMHRQSFGMAEAPAGSVILYCQSCNLRDRDLVDRFDILAHGKSNAETGDEEEPDSDDDSGEETGTNGSTVKLKKWDSRKRKDLGLDALGYKAPLIDRVHHIMQLWSTGDQQKVDSYLEETGLRRSSAFPKLLQALIELARNEGQTDEVSLLESIMNHVTGLGMHYQTSMNTEEQNS